MKLLQRNATVRWRQATLSLGSASPGGREAIRNSAGPGLQKRWHAAKCEAKSSVSASTETGASPFQTTSVFRALGSPGENRERSATRPRVAAGAAGLSRRRRASLRTKPVRTNPARPLPDGTIGRQLATAMLRHRAADALEIQPRRYRMLRPECLRRKCCEARPFQPTDARAGDSGRPSRNRRSRRRRPSGRERGGRTIDYPSTERPEHGTSTSSRTAISPCRSVRGPAIQPRRSGDSFFRAFLADCTNSGIDSTPTAARASRPSVTDEYPVAHPASRSMSSLPISAA